MAHFLVYNTSDATRPLDTPLIANASTNLGVIQAQQEGVLTGTVKSDQSGSLFVDQSFDGINWDFTTTIAVTGGTGALVTASGSSGGIPIIAPFVQVRYTNSTVGQAFLRIFVRSFGTKTG